MEKQTYNFETTLNLSLENSFTTIKEEDNIKMQISIGINNEEYGWFEMYDIETGGNNWYAEGGLWFSGMSLRDYDGVFCLPEAIISKLNEIGIDTSDI